MSCNKGFLVLVGFVLAVWLAPRTTPTFAQALPPVAWVARYNGTADQIDTPSSAAADRWGNVYLTGRTYDISSGASAYITIKYSAIGSQMWLRRYDGPGTSSAFASDLTVDNEGNAYVTGSAAQVPNGLNDYVTLKYDANGNGMWLRRYSGGQSLATAVALDPSGNVYVTGSSSRLPASITTDFATTKYDTHGNELWLRRYDGSGNGNDRVSALAVDSVGNAYVSGTSSSSTGTDYATVKYDTSGNQLWVARYNGSGNRADVASALAVDASGNVHVTGRSEAGNGFFDFVTLKYDTNGNQVWAARYNGPRLCSHLVGAFPVPVPVKCQLWKSGMRCAMISGNVFKDWVYRVVTVMSE